MKRATGSAGFDVSNASQDRQRGCPSIDLAQRIPDQNGIGSFLQHEVKYCVSLPFYEHHVAHADGLY